MKINIVLFFFAMAINNGIEKPDYADHPNGYSQSEEMDKRNRSEIRVYTEEEIAGIKEACRIGREVLDAAGAAVAVGVTADALDKIVHEETVKRGAYPSPLNYYNFPKSVCTSVNEVICHGIPDMACLTWHPWHGMHIVSHLLSIVSSRH